MITPNIDPQDPSQLGNQDGSPTDPQPDATPNQDGTSGQPAAGQPDLTALQQENARLKGQVSSVQKKYQQLVRGSMQRQTTPMVNQGEGQDDPTEIVYAALSMAGAKLRDELEADIFPFYDGSDEAAGSPLPAAELNRIRRNPWAFVSTEAQRHALVTGDLQPAKLEIEEAMSNRIAELEKSNPTPTPKIPSKDINPNPAPSGDPGQAQSNEQDLWSMPMEELEQLARQKASR